MKLGQFLIWGLALLMSNRGVICRMDADRGDTVRQLYLMGFSANEVSGGGWSSAGVIPAINMAIKDINERDDILTDYELILDMRDTQCSEGVAINNFIKQIRMPDPRIMILGGGCSIATEPIARVAPYFYLNQMAFSAASPELSQRGKFPTFFRTAMSDLVINKPIVNICLHFDWMHVATIAENDPLFTITFNQLHYYFTEANITLITAETFNPEMGPKEPLKNIQRKKGKIIMFNGYESPARQTFCEVYKLQMYGPRYQWIIPGWYGDNWLEVNDTDCPVWQVQEAALYALTVTDLKTDLSENKTISGQVTKCRIYAAQQTFEDYEARYLNSSDFKEYGYNGYHPCGYDAVWAVSLALNDTIPIIATMNITVVDENGTEYTRPMRLDDYNYTESPNISAAIYSSLSKARFHGVSGPVSFEFGERQPICEIRQVRDDFPRVAVYYDEAQLLVFMDDEEILWRGTGPPLSKSDPQYVIQYNYLWLVITAWVISALGLVLATCFVVFNIRNRDHNHIKMSSPNLNNLIVFGCMLAYISVLILGLDTRFVSDYDMKHICSAQRWLLCTSFTLSFGAMFAKTWRVHRVFTKLPGSSPPAVHDVHLFCFIGVLLLIDFSILTARDIINPFYVDYTDTSQTEDVDGYITIYQIELCLCDNGVYWLAALYAYNGLLLIFGCFLAYETRNVLVPGLNDSKYIGFCVYNLVVMCLVGGTVVLVMYDQGNVTFCIQAFCCFFCTYCTLCLVFVPKVKHVKKYPKKPATTSSNLSTDNFSSSSTFQYTVKQVYKKQEDGAVYSISDGKQTAEVQPSGQSVSGKKHKETDDLKSNQTNLNNAPAVEIPQPPSPKKSDNTPTVKVYQPPSPKKSDNTPTDKVYQPPSPKKSDNTPTVRVYQPPSPKKSDNENKPASGDEDLSRDREPDKETVTTKAEETENDVKPLDTATMEQTDTPMMEQTDTPTMEQIDMPRKEQTDTPTMKQTDTPTMEQTDTPTIEQTDTPTMEQIDTPTMEQTDTPTMEQTDTPMMEQTDTPTMEQTDTPTMEQIDTPTMEQTDTPTMEQTDTPTMEQTDTPTMKQTDTPTIESHDQNTASDVYLSVEHNVGYENRAFTEIA